MRWLDGIINLMVMTLSKFWEIVKDREAWLAAVHGVTSSQITLMRSFMGHAFRTRVIKKGVFDSKQESLCYGLQ